MTFTFDNHLMTRMKSILLLTFLAAGPLAIAADEDKAEQLARTVVLDEMAVKNLRIETVAEEKVAEAVMAHLAAAWFPRFAVFAWVTDAEVMRPGKYA